MGVSGFTRPPERCEGGLSDVWLAAADDIAACTYDGATGTFGAVRLREGAAFARYEFAEDTARYRQYVSGDAPACVVHELSFALRRADAGSTVALASLLGRLRRDVSRRLVARFRRGVSVAARFGGVRYTGRLR